MKTLQKNKRNKNWVNFASCGTFKTPKSFQLQGALLLDPAQTPSVGSPWASPNKLTHSSSTVVE